jgi:GT2 family glycosyltransferase
MMYSEGSVSIILCTCNRAAALQQTLAALENLEFCSSRKVEVIVVDNASTDDTATATQNAKLSNMEVRYFYEARKGKAHALNSGLATARGEIILFTDDDVLLAEDWVEQMISSLVDDGYDAVTGQITLAQHLMRPWLSPMQRWNLASSNDAQLYEGVRELIGANMGFRRSVLERVPRFDPELGPGALGFAEDTLFGWQLVQAGFKVGYAPKARAIHQLDVSRLRRRNWLNDSRKRGRTEAYRLYHWEHGDITSPHLKWLWCWIKLRLRRVLQRPPSLDSEGCPGWEMSYVASMETFKQFCIEQRRPRNYSRRGLTKLHG